MNEKFIVKKERERVQKRKEWDEESFVYQEKKMHWLSNYF